MSEITELSIKMIENHILELLTIGPLSKKELLSRMWLQNLASYALVELALRNLEAKKKILKEGEKYRKTTLTFLEEELPRRNQAINPFERFNNSEQISIEIMR